MNELHDLKDAKNTKLSTWQKIPLWLKVFTLIFLVVAVGDFVVGFSEGVR